VLLRSIRSGVIVTAVESSLPLIRHGARPPGVVPRSSRTPATAPTRGEFPTTEPLPAGSFQPPKAVVCDRSTPAVVDVAALAEQPARRSWAGTRSGA
jgi:hypothetical protein